MPSMRYRRAGSSAAVYNGKIYVAGGFDDVSPLEKCECFDPVEKTWVEIAPLAEPRGGVGLAELQGTELLNLFHFIYQHKIKLKYIFGQFIL